MTDEEMGSLGLSTEKRLVRIWIEGEMHLEEYDVWYSPVARERTRQAFRPLQGDEEEVKSEQAI